MRLQKIVDHLFLVEGENKGKFPLSNAFLIQDKACALIDTGCGITTLREIKEAYLIDLIINSHGHPDHCAGNWVFLDVPLYAPREGEESHGNLHALSERFLGPGENAGAWRPWISNLMGFKDRSPTNFYSHGDVFDFGTLKLEAVHTPGHTCDHYCFMDKTHRILLSFDIDLTEFGPWYGNLESSLKQFRRSFEIIRDLEPSVIASGHAAPVSQQIKETIFKYSRILDKRNESLLKLITPGIEKADLIREAPIYGRTFDFEVMNFFEKRMIELHLEELLEKELIECQGTRYCLRQCGQ